MERITQEHLESLVEYLNKITNSPLETYTKQGDKYLANIGNYHLDWAYGGVKLSRICNDAGGTSNISDMGYGTKRELYNWLKAYIAGIEYIQN